MHAWIVYRRQDAQCVPYAFIRFAESAEDALAQADCDACDLAVEADGAPAADALCAQYRQRVREVAQRAAARRPHKSKARLLTLA